MSRVYRGFDSRRRRRVAIKVPVGRYRTDSQIQAFRTEFRHNRALRHPNVLPNIDFFVAGEVPVLISPLGRASLDVRLELPLPRNRLVQYAHDMLLALAHAHRHHILHLDVKPENLMLLWHGRLALADFGAARRGHRTVRGDYIGTRGYMAPEQADGRPSARSDVFAAGIVIREMLWGREETAQSPRPRRRVPEALLELIERATQADPADRYRDAGDMLTEFRRIEARLARARRALRA